MSRKRTLVDHGFRLPSAMDNRPLRFEEFVERIGQTVYLSATPGQLRAGPVRRLRRAAHPADRPGRPAGHRQADAGPDRRPDGARSGADRAARAGAGHHLDQEDGRGPDRLPAGERHPDALSALRGRHPAADPAAPRAADGGVRRAGRHQPAARGPRPARGVPGRDPGRRQGGLPAQRQEPDPDHRPRGTQRVRRGPHVCRLDHRLDGGGDRRDQPPAREAGRLQRGQGVDPQPLRKKIADITDMLAREDADTEDLLGSGAPRPRQVAGPGRLEGCGRTRRKLAAMPPADLADLVHSSPTRCTAPPPISSSRSPPGCGTRSPSSRRSCGRWWRPARGSNRPDGSVRPW